MFNNCGSRFELFFFLSNKIVLQMVFFPLFFSEKDRSYECVSFVETQASSLLKEFPVEFVKYPFFKTKITLSVSV